MPEETVETNPQESLLCSNCGILYRQLDESLKRNTALFHAMLAHSKDAILLTGPDGRIIRIVRSISGYAPLDMAGTPVEFLAHPDDREAIHDCYRRLLSRECSTGEIEVRAMRPDGSFFWVEATFSDMLDSPDVQAIICNYRDITARKEQELTRAEYEAIIQSAEYAIFSKDIDGQILTWNNGAERVFGYASAEIIGRNVSLIVPEDRREFERANRKRVIAGRTAVEFQTEILRKDGSQIPAIMHLAPIFDGRGGVRGIAHVSRPIR